LCKPTVWQFYSKSFNTTSKVMADDVTAQIVRLYPAANTQFNLRHEVNDPFGKALIENLRLEGFAVQEATSAINSAANLCCAEST
jgi:hypothetical protein